MKKFGRSGVLPLLAVLFSAIMIFSCKNMQIGKDAKEKESFLEVGGDSSLVIYTPHFRDVDLVCGKMPDYQVDTDILLCCEAAFTGELLEEFSHSNIAGNHMSGGVFYQGYDCADNTGEFVSDGRRWTFSLLKRKSGDEPFAESLMPNGLNATDVNERPLKMGFGQTMIIYDFKTQPRFRDRLPDGRYYFRSLCSLNGELCIVDSKQEIRYAEYVELLEKLGVQFALYLDMGSGWNHSWYRKKAGEDVTVIHPWIEKCKFTTNWIVFR